MPKPPKSPVNAVAASDANLDFQLHSLGWKSFQDLALVILRDQLGQAVQEYSAVNDAGKDGAFLGEWSPVPGLQLTGSTIVQCKFTSRAQAALTPSGFEEELRKIKRLWKTKEPNNYVLITNHSVTGEFEEATRTRCHTFGCHHFHVFGREWITSAIRTSPRLRMLVPRLYGLGDLSQILDERWYRQTERLLDEERSNLKKFVPTRSYHRAVRAADTHGFVLLLGAPAAGKTAIAAMISLAAGDAWQCRPMKLERPGELRRHWNPSDPKQLFWIDDAFGMLQYDLGRAQEWNAVLPWLNVILAAGGRIILTSRNYIYSRARTDLKHSAFPLLKEAEVVVDVAEMTLRERERILYNHIRLGGQPRAWRRSFKLCFDTVAQHPGFMPEIARRLGNPAYTDGLQIPRDATAFVERPEAFLRETIEGLSSDDKAALAAIFIRGGSLKSPAVFVDAEEKLLERLGSTAHLASMSLNTLRDSFVRYSPSSESWEYRHPTIGDAFASIVASNPELLDLYIVGVPVSRLLREVTCGVNNVEGAKLLVAPSRFSLVSEKLRNYVLSGAWNERSDRQRLWSSFLAYRCSADFLRSHFSANPSLLELTLSIGSYLSVAAHFPLLKQLRKHRILTEEQVANIVHKVRRLAVDTPDADFIGVDSIRSFFTAEELDSITTAVRDELIPNLSDVVAEWESNRSSDEDVDAYYDTLVDALSTFRAHFKSDREAEHAIDRAIATIKEIIEENTRPEANEDNDGYFRASRDASHQPDADRPIYDDLDE